MSYHLGVRIYENSILATADTGGWIKFCKIKLPKLKAMFADKTYDGKDDKGYSHLDHDGDFLVSGASHGEVIAWDFLEKDFTKSNLNNVLLHYESNGQLF